MAARAAKAGSHRRQPNVIKIKKYISINNNMDMQDRLQRQDNDKHPTYPAHPVFINKFLYFDDIGLTPVATCFGRFRGHR